MSVQSIVKSSQYVQLTDARTLYGDAHEAQPLLLVENAVCRAVIAIQGAHLVEYSARAKAPLLWLSPKAVFKSGKAIRGGVPVCFPWFGENQLAEGMPSHGFVRAQDWQLTEIVEENNSVSLAFSFSSNEQTLKLYPYEFNAEYRITLANDIRLSLSTVNKSDDIMPVSFALHSYHPIHDLANVEIEGLHYTTYLDNTQSYQARIQQGPIKFNGELDRIYLNVGEQQTIVSKPSIVLKSEQCKSAIVWNPGPHKASKMTDLGEENYTQFVCLERGNAFSDSWYLQPGEQRSADLTIGYGE